MSNQGNGAELVQNRVLQNLLAKMDDDSDKAAAQWKTQSNNPVFAKFPQGFLAEYKDDASREIKARGNFNLEWNKVVAGRGDPKKLMSAYDAYSGNLEALIENNARFKALIDLDFAGKSAAWLTVLLGLAKYGHGLELARELKELKAELERAEKEVSEAKLKRVLNVAVSAATLVAAPEAVLARVLVAAGGITIHIIIDNALGHSTVKGTVVFIAGDGVDAIKKLNEAGKKLVGAAAAVLTFKFDSDEVVHGQEIVNRLRPKFERTLKAYQDLMAGVLPLIPKLQALDAGIKALNQEAKRAMTRTGDANKNYRAIKESIKKAI